MRIPREELLFCNYNFIIIITGNESTSIVHSLLFQHIQKGCIHSVNKILLITTKYIQISFNPNSAKIGKRKPARLQITMFSQSIHLTAGTYFKCHSMSKPCFTVPLGKVVSVQCLTTSPSCLKPLSYALCCTPGIFAERTRTFYWGALENK